MAQPSDMIVYDNSLRPSTQKSIVRKWADLLTLGHATDALRAAERSVGVGPVAATLHVIRGNGEAGVTGALLGAVSGAGGLDRAGVPVDAAASAVSGALGVALCRSELGITLRQVSAASMAVFSFRKTEEWLGVRKKSTFAGDDWNDPNTVNADVAVDIGEDPIVQAAKEL